mgnify:CR=1 FL=1
MLARGNIILAVVLILLFVGAIPIVLYITTKDEKTQANAPGPGVGHGVGRGHF